MLATIKNTYQQFFQKKIAKFAEQLKIRVPAFNQILQKENEQMKGKIVDLSLKCKKLTVDGEDLERLLNEQSSIIKALNVRRILRNFIVSCVISSLLIAFDEIVQ